MIISAHDLLSAVQHRPFDLPAGRWLYYQEWNQALFLHYRVPLELLRQLVPGRLHIDTFENEAYISIVAFTMQKIRPRLLPAVAFVSDFAEINVRTYINNNEKQGVYFLNIEAEKWLSAFLAKKLSGLPYEKAAMQQTENSFSSVNKKKNFRFNAEFKLCDQPAPKTPLDLWLTERYCLYLEQGQNLYRYDIHHKEWGLRSVDLTALAVDYKIGSLHISGPPDYINYSDGVQVVAWHKNKV